MGTDVRGGTYSATGEQGKDNTLATLLRAAPEGQETLIEVAQEMLLNVKGEATGEKKITVALQRRKMNEEAPAEPVRAPSPKRRHCFFDIDGFGDYLKRFGGEDTLVLSNPEASMMTVVLDERATDGYELIAFKPQIHPVFRPWENLLNVGKPVPIREFVDFISNNRRIIANPNGRDLLMSLMQVRMSREVELHQGEGSKSLNGILVRTNVTGGGTGGSQTSYVDLPETITIKTPIYLGTGITELEIDLIVGGNEQTGVVVRVSAGDLLQKRVEQFELMFNTLRGLLPKVTLGSGDVNHMAWEYLKN